MTYRIARSGEIFGPYTEAEVRRYIASGNILLTDLAQPVGQAEWVSVLQQFPFAVGSATGPASADVPMPIPISSPVSGPATVYPDPPDLPWWLALVLAIITGGVFIVVWDIVQAAWVRRVQPASNALFLYVALAAVYLVRLPSNWATVSYNIFAGPPVRPHHGFLLFLAWLALFVASRSAIRKDLLHHFNGPEPLGLHLNTFFVYLFGGLYLQYHFNRVNEIKRALRVGVPVL